MKLSGSSIALLLYASFSSSATALDPDDLPPAAIDPMTQLQEHEHVRGLRQRNQGGSKSGKGDFPGELIDYVTVAKQIVHSMPCEYCGDPCFIVGGEDAAEALNKIADAIVVDATTVDSLKAIPVHFGSGLCGSDMECKVPEDDKTYDDDIAFFDAVQAECDGPVHPRFEFDATYGIIKTALSTPAGQSGAENFMLRHLLDACGLAIAFWSVGFAFAYGANFSSAPFFGFFQWAFAATAATIVAGTVAERASNINRKLTDVVNSRTRMFAAYLAYSLMLTGFVYPVVVRSSWITAGFLSDFKQEETIYLAARMMDFAGSGLVHMAGGATALIAATILGPRIGRFYDEGDNDALSFPPHNVALQVLGTFILWFGWYGFNPGSALGFNPGSALGFNPGSALGFNPGSTLAMGSTTLVEVILILASSANPGANLFDLVSYLFLGRAPNNDVLANPVYESVELTGFMSEVFGEIENMFMEVEA